MNVTLLNMCNNPESFEENHFVYLIIMKIKKSNWENFLKVYYL